MRDEGLLDSALARPMNRAAYETPDRRTGRQLRGRRCQNHAFVDGNKRVAFLCVGLFLAINGWRLQSLNWRPLRRCSRLLESLMKPLLPNGCGNISWRVDQNAGGDRALKRLACEQGRTGGRRSDVVEPKTRLQRMPFKITGGRGWRTAVR